MGQKLAVAAFLATIVATGVTLWHVFDQQPDPNGSPRGWTLRGVILLGSVFGLPLLVTLVACVTRGRVAIINRWAAVGVLTLPCAFFWLSFAPLLAALYLVPLGLVAASATRSGQHAQGPGQQHVPL